MPPAGRMLLQPAGRMLLQELMLPMQGAKLAKLLAVAVVRFDLATRKIIEHFCCDGMDHFAQELLAHLEVAPEPPAFLQVLVITVLHQNCHLFAGAVDFLRRRITWSVWDMGELDIHGHSVAWIT
jgi:hypothetical protein